MGLLARLRVHSQDGLVRGSAGVVLAFLLTQWFGFVFWIIAARRFDPDAVGAITAAGSAMTLSALLVTAGIPPLLLRILPVSGNRVKPRVRMVLTWTIAASMASGLVIGLLSNAQEPIVLFFIVVGAVFTALAVVGDAIATAGRATRLVAVRGVTASAGKIALIFVPFPLLGMTFGVSAGLFAWVISMAVSALYILWASRASLAALETLPSHESHQPWRMAAANHVTVIGQQLPILALPVLAGAIVGDEVAGLLYVPWLIGTAIYTLPGLVAGVLLAEGAREAGETSALLHRAVRLLLLTVVPAAVVAALFAPLLLGLFSEEYVVGTPILILVSLSTIPVCIKALTFSIWRLNNRTSRCALLALSSGTAATLATWMVLVTGAPLTLIALAWFAIQGMSALVALPTLVGAMRAKRT